MRRGSTRDGPSITPTPPANAFVPVDDLADAVIGVREFLQPDGMFVFEVPYLLDVVEKVLFDTIYHEHLSYHSVHPPEGFFRRHGLELDSTTTKRTLRDGPPARVSRTHRFL